MCLDIEIYHSSGDGMAGFAVSRTENLKVLAVARGYLIFPAQKDEPHQEQLQSPGVVR